MKIINLGAEDYHIHSLNYSDGMNTVDEIVKAAGELGLTRIAITDHSQATLDYYGLAMKNFRQTTRQWVNTHNKTEVIFGIEGDLLTELGDICDDIQGIPTEFLILSAHEGVYKGPPQKITQAYIRAIDRHHKAIKFIGHVHAGFFASTVNVPEVVKAANDHGIPLELNGSYLGKRGDERNVQQMLERADQIYVNSDAHTLYGLQTLRAKCFEYLRKHKLLE